MKPGVDVIVVNYRTSDLLASFLESNRIYGHPESDTWVMQVAPTRADLAVQLPAGAHQIVFDNNVGYAKAVNHAVALGCREFLAIFNADTELWPTTMHQCLEALLANRDWGVLGPRQIDRSGRLTHAGIFGTLDAPTHRAWHRPNRPEFGDVRAAVTVSGSAYFTRRSLWRELHSCPEYRKAVVEYTGADVEGAFLPTQHYYEETWYSYHAQAHGWKVMYYGPAEMLHHWHRASKMGVAERRMAESREMFRAVCDAHLILHD